eukprot:3747742-Rhodomonas_salina.1
MARRWPSPRQRGTSQRHDARPAARWLPPPQAREPPLGPVPLRRRARWHPRSARRSLAGWPGGTRRYCCQTLSASGQSPGVAGCAISVPDAAAECALSALAFPKPRYDCACPISCWGVNLTGGNLGHGKGTHLEGHQVAHDLLGGLLGVEHGMCLDSVLGGPVFNDSAVGRALVRGVVDRRLHAEKSWRGAGADEEAAAGSGGGADLNDDVEEREDEEENVERQHHVPHPIALRRLLLASLRRMCQGEPRSRVSMVSSGRLRGRVCVCARLGQCLNVEANASALHPC